MKPYGGIGSDPKQSFDAYKMYGPSSFTPYLPNYADKQITPEAAPKLNSKTFAPPSHASVVDNRTINNSGTKFPNSNIVRDQKSQQDMSTLPVKSIAVKTAGYAATKVLMKYDNINSQSMKDDAIFAAVELIFELVGKDKINQWVTQMYPSIGVTDSTQTQDIISELIFVGAAYKLLDLVGVHQRPFVHTLIACAGGIGAEYAAETVGFI
jgi:hypothetical protein